MSNKIKILEKAIANQIAAGEVAERPTLIIKELMENSIDAGADNIRIFLKNSGFDEMRIIDNGEGIARDDIEIAFQRHSTSKLRDIGDLSTLYTMGFRGEALASIAAVSQVFLTTKPPDQDTGYKGIVEGGEFIELKPAPCNNGTEIIVRDLFYNTPARKKFLATPTRELRDVSDMVGKIIISHPNIAVELRNNNKKIFQSSGRGDMLAAIMSVYGRDLVKKLLPLNSDGFNGYISHPGYNKPSRNYYHFYINGRYIQSDALNRSLETAYHTMMPERRFPVAFINILVEPSEYDINVHPNKLDIKFNKEAKIEEKLIEAVGEALLATDRSYGEEIRTRHKLASPSGQYDYTQQDGVVENSLSRNTGNETEANDQPRPKSNHAVKPDKFVELREKSPINLQDIAKFASPAWQELTYLDVDEVTSETKRQEAKVVNNSIIEAFKNTDSESEIDAKIRKTLLQDDRTLALDTTFDEFTNKQKLDLESGFYSSLSILGQLAATFIVAAQEDALYLIDQHAAHERLLFNKIKKSLANASIPRQPLLIPMEFKTNYQQYAWLMENIIILRDLGFILEEFGDNSFIIREVPVWAQDIDIISFLSEIADGCIKQGSKLLIENILESKVMMRACKSAIKANKYLDKSDIHYLFTELDLAEDAFTCPHGRPITIKYTVEEIRRKFLRS